MAGKRQPNSLFSATGITASQIQKFAAQQVSRAMARYTWPKKSSAPSRQRLTGPIRYHSTKYKKKPLSIAEMALKNLPYKIINREEGSRFTCSLGRQAYRIAQEICDNRMMFDILSQAEGKTVDANHNYKFYIKSVSYEMMVKNQTNTQVVLYVYDMAPKHKEDLTILQSIEAGDNAMSTGDGDPLTNQNISSKPMTFPAVYKNWYQKSVKKLVLQAGEVRIIKINRPVNKYFNSTHLQSAANIYRAFPGITTTTLLRLHGTPVNDSAAEGNVSTSSGRVDFTSYQKIVYKFIENSQSKSEITNKFRQTFIGNEDVMEEATDSKDQVTSA